MALTKPAGSWTYADLAKLPDDGTQFEIIEGELYEMPPPLLAHASVVIALIDLLLPLIKGMGGRLWTAPVGVFFAGADPVEPDIVVLLPGGSARRSRNGIEGPPDLLIEVLSPSNRAHDQIRKRALYANGGGRGRVVRHGVVGPPDLLTEVLSPSNRAHDQVRKRALYARGGVREYWIVDPDAASIEIIGADGETVQLTTAETASVLALNSPLLGDLAADPALLFPTDTEG